MTDFTCVNSWFDMDMGNHYDIIFSYNGQVDTIFMVINGKRVSNQVCVDSQSRHRL